jgi:hypothetical protein
MPVPGFYFHSGVKASLRYGFYLRNPGRRSRSVEKLVYLPNEEVAKLLHRGEKEQWLDAGRVT